MTATVASCWPRRLAALDDGRHELADAGGRRWLAKKRRSAPAGFFAAEADGLAALAASRTLRVPRIAHCQADGIVLEHLGQGRADTAFWRAAGAGLAALHSVAGRSFGWDRDGWCGDTPQDNTRDGDGHRFFARRRLLPMLRRCRDAGRLDAAEVAAGERLVARLPASIPQQQPVLVHGDLWLGNLHCCGDGTPALIDAGAVHHGWAEADLAMLTLFGEPPPVFWTTYRDHGRLDTGWRDRAALYNLHHLLNHLLLFGAGYHAQVRAILDPWRGFR